MKILFVTGDEKCECEGDGWVMSVVNDCVGEPHYLRTLCKCVGTKEAAAERVFKTIALRGKPAEVVASYDRVVPKKE